MPILTAVVACLLPQGPLPPSLALAALARPRDGLRSVQFSSADPSGANVDHGHYVRTRSDGHHVLAEAHGAGAITRIWSANPAGTLRIEVDDGVAFEGPFEQLFARGAPLAGPSGGGFASHVPVPFARRCQVLLLAGSTDAQWLYYHVGLELGARAGREAALRTARAAAPTARVTTARVRVRGGDRATALALDGPGRLHELSVELPEPLPHRRLWLEVRADGARRPCIVAPIEDLFGLGGVGGPGLRTQVVTGEDARHRTLRLPMPFAERLEVTLEHVGDPGEAPLAGTFRAEHAALRAPGEGLYLHAQFRRAATRWGEPHRVARVRGRGHLVGVLLSVAPDTAQGLSYLEGDERIAVDDAVVYAGTGTEDYFSGAWYFRGGPFARPFAGVSVIDGQGRTTMARWHVPDPVPFAASLDFTLEHGGHDDCPNADYASLAWFYLATPDGTRTVPRQLRRLWSDRPQRRPHPQVFEPPDRAVLGAGEHELWLADRPDWSCARATALDAQGQALGPPVIQVPAPPGTPGLGRKPAGGGPVAVRLDRGGTVAAVRYEPYLDALRDWQVVGPFAARDRRGIDTEYPPERDWHAARYASEDGDVAWQPLDLTARADGIADLDPLFGHRDHAVAYAKTILWSERAATATLVLGSDDAVQVFLNGDVVHRHAVLRGVGRDQDRVAVQLRAGENSLVLKVEDYRGGWGFVARLER